MYTAIEHYISGGDLVTAGDLIAVHATALLNGGQIFTVLRLLDRLGDLPERHSRSALVRGWINLSTGRFAGARHYYDVAAEFDDGTDANLTASLGIMVHLAEGDLGEALSIAEPHDRADRVDPGHRSGCRSHVGRDCSTRHAGTSQSPVSSAPPNHRTMRQRSPRVSRRSSSSSRAT